MIILTKGLTQKEEYSIFKKNEEDALTLSGLDKTPLQITFFSLFFLLHQ